MLDTSVSSKQSLRTQPNGLSNLVVKPQGRTSTVLRNATVLFWATKAAVSVEQKINRTFEPRQENPYCLLSIPGCILGTLKPSNKNKIHHGVKKFPSNPGVEPRIGGKPPKMDGLYIMVPTLLKWMIWGYHYLWKHPPGYSKHRFASSKSLRDFSRLPSLAALNKEAANLFRLAAGFSSDLA